MQQTFQKKIQEANIKYELFKPGDKILAALSGGADSVSLVCALKEFYPQNEIYACHVNHMLRGAEADRDEEFVKDLCLKRNIVLEVLKIDVDSIAKAQGMSTELAARKIRYDFFEKVCIKYGIHLVATAHTLTDSAETAVYNFARGTGISGLCGIPPKRKLTEKISLIRPLICASRNDVESYLESISQNFVTDSTNFTDDYTRNKIRHNVVPKLKEINPAFEQSLKNTSDILRNIQIFIQKSVNNSMTDDVFELAKLDKCILRYVIMRLYENIGSEYQLEKIHIDAVAELILNYADGSKADEICLPGNISAVIKSGKLIFTQTERRNSKKEISAYSYPLPNGLTPISDTDFIVERTDCAFPTPPDGYFCAAKTLLDFSKINGELSVRNRKPGDKIILHKQHKSVKELFIKNKINAEIRNIIPFVCDSAEILFIPFIGNCEKHSDKNITDDNKVYIYIYSANLQFQSKQEIYDEKKH